MYETSLLCNEEGTESFGEVSKAGVGDIIIADDCLISYREKIPCLSFLFSFCFVLLFDFQSFLLGFFFTLTYVSGLICPGWERETGGGRGGVLLCLT